MSRGVNAIKQIETDFFLDLFHNFQNSIIFDANHAKFRETMRKGGFLALFREGLCISHQKILPKTPNSGL